MGTTSDRNDPRLTHGPDSAPTGQAPVYLVLSDEERAKGFVRPVRRTYVHRYMRDGSHVPTVLTSLEGVAGCGAATTMGQAIAETYATRPGLLRLHVLRRLPPASAGGAVPLGRRLRNGGLLMPELKVILNIEDGELGRYVTPGYTSDLPRSAAMLSYAAALSIIIVALASAASLLILVSGWTL